MNVNSALVVCMGVSGAGKSTVAASVAENCGLYFLEADDFHSDADKQRMASGEALTDSDREPWMQSICEELSKSQRNCSTASSTAWNQPKTRMTLSKSMSVTTESTLKHRYLGSLTNS